MPSLHDTPIPSSRLDGKVAIVTGASSGFGERFSRVLADAGATVVACARRLDRLEQLASEVDGIVATQCDVSCDDQLSDVVEFASSLPGDLAVLVNNAGSSDAVTRAEDEDPAVFRRVVDVNLNACFVLAAMTATRMIERGTGGSIVNIGSVHGFVSASPNHQAAYVASKGAIHTLTKELAAQWARHSIRVNTIAPGYFETELTHLMFHGEAAAGGRRYIESGTYLRRAGIEGELDGALLLLATDLGSYITGQTITVDGGWTSK
ncbi:MAG: SDR family NAD(P)-dependent oxidoreductase [Actinomycetia bacterium]|nr:SDR family NAD(P)-dependent oxidoreductase [Actinomycetes bacterium]MCP4960005.1 SDR family NAD(P)-dependent oxidoreductase [Actinomycetes bacterium]